MAADKNTLGYLLMDAAGRRWYDARQDVWIALSYVEGDEEVADFLPPPEAFRDDLAEARRNARDLKRRGVYVYPMKVRVPC